MSRLIVYKDIEHERLGDAPFVGALIIAAQCTGNCEGCFNQHVKEEPNKFDTTTHLLALVRANPFNEGIILGGLEWSEQPEDMLDLIKEALGYQMKVMIYTRLTEDVFLNKFPELIGKGVFCKFGAYDLKYKSDTHFSYGVKLATTNQYIKYLKNI